MAQIRVATSAPLLEARGLTKDFPGVRALDDVSFDVRPGEVHALVGENGAGKSTLIKILGGVYPRGSFAGAVLVEGRPVRFAGVCDATAAGISVIHQELALVRTLTVGENVFLGDEPTRWGIVAWDALHEQAADVLARLGLRMDTHAEVSHLGVAAQQLVEIAKSVRQDSRVLILDEPTAALADREVDVLMGIMRDLRRAGRGLAYISHKLDEVLRIADRITVLRDGRRIDTRAAGDWTRPAIVSAMVGREMAEMFPSVSRSPGRCLLKARNLVVEDPDTPGRNLLTDVSLSVRQGEVLGIAGLMGAGRTELLRTLFGDAPGPWRGEIEIDGKPAAIACPADAIAAGVALLPEDRKNDGLVLDFAVRENLSMAHLADFCKAGWVDAHRERARCTEVAEQVGVRAASVETPVEVLSGGNQQKVALGKWLVRPPRVLLLDEPTRGIDVGAKAEIHRQVGEMSARGMAVVMASSELPELLNVADRILVLREGQVAGRFDRESVTAEGIMACAT